MKPAISNLWTPAAYAALDKKLDASIALALAKIKLSLSQTKTPPK